MFRKIKYTIENNKIVLYPSHFLTPVFLILYIVLMITAVIILTNAGGGAISTAALIKSISILAVVCALFLLLPAAIFSTRKIIFDAGTQAIYRQGLTGRKNIMAFTDAADILKRNAVNTNGFFLVKKGDRYGKGIFLSPAHFKKINAFETDVLPEINKMLLNATPARTPATADSRHGGNTIAFAQGQFNYYTLRDSKYFVKGKGAVRYGISLLIVLILAGIFIWLFAADRVTDDSDSIYRYILLLPIIFLSAMLSKRVYFDAATKEFVVKYFGLTFEKEALEKFTNFLVTRKTHNGMHSGTDVRLKFSTANNKEKRSSHLYDFKKTKNIEGFMEETQYIMSAITVYKINGPQ